MKFTLFTLPTVSLGTACAFFLVTLCLLSHWVCDCESVMTLYLLNFSSIRTQTFRQTEFELDFSSLCMLHCSAHWSTGRCGMLLVTVKLWEVYRSLVFASSCDWADKISHMWEPNCPKCWTNAVKVQWTLYVNFYFKSRLLQNIFCHYWKINVL